MSASAGAAETGGPISGPPAPALELHRVSKTFVGRTVLDIEHMHIGAGEVHALLGQNGSGKSTLIKILSGYHRHDRDASTRISIAGKDQLEGSLERSQDQAIRIVHQDLGLVQELSIMDNIYLGRGYPTRAWTVQRNMARAGAREALARVGMQHMDPSTKVADITPAERTGVAIARALAHDKDGAPSLLVLDEPTATLPAPEIDRLMATLEKLAAEGIAILYVTHHLDEVFRIASNLTVLRDGRVVASGATSTFSHADVVHHLVGSELEEVHKSTTPSRSQRAAGSGAGLRVTEMSAERLEPVSFDVQPGEVMGLYGVAGSGRDTVLGAIYGALEREGGSVRIGSDELAPHRPDLAIGLGMGFVPADRKASGGFLGLTARENITLPDVRSFWRAGRIDRRAEEDEARTWFERMDVRPRGGLDLPLSTFSGGNQQKVILAKWLRQRPRVLLLDEPTQGVDVGAKATIHRMILTAVEADLAVLIASSDDQEMAALCSRVHIMHRGRIVDTLAGDEISESALRRRQNLAGQSTPVEGARP